MINDNDEEEKEENCSGHPLDLLVCLSVCVCVWDLRNSKEIRVSN